MLEPADLIELKWNRKDLGSLRTVLDKHVEGRRVAVQAGACLGVFPELLASQFDWVYSFEPDPRLHRMCARRLSEIRNVILQQAALGLHRRPVRTECSLRPNDGKTTLHPGMTRTERDGECPIPVIRIDDLGLRECDLIYLDVEGDELWALQGAEDTLGRCRPIVVCELNRGLTYRGFAEGDLVTYLRMAGYDEAERLRSDVVFLPRGGINGGGA